MDAEIHHPSTKSFSTGSLDLATKDEMVVVTQTPYNHLSRDGLPDSMPHQWSTEIGNGVKEHFTKIGVFTDTPKLDVVERLKDGRVSSVEVTISPESWDYAALLRFEAAVALQRDLKELLDELSSALEFVLTPDRKTMKVSLTWQADISEYDHDFSDEDFAAGMRLWDAVKRNLERVGMQVDVTPELKEFWRGGYGASWKFYGVEVAVAAFSGVQNLREYLANETSRGVERELTRMAALREPLLNGWLGSFDEQSADGQSIMGRSRTETTAALPETPRSVWQLRLPADSYEYATRLHRRLSAMGISLAPLDDSIRGTVGIIFEDPHEDALNRAFRDFYKLD